MFTVCRGVTDRPVDVFDASAGVWMTSVSVPDMVVSKVVGDFATRVFTADIDFAGPTTGNAHLPSESVFYRVHRALSTP